MPFWVVSWIGRGIGVIDGMEVVEVKRQILGATVGHPIEPTGLCGVVILCREGWRRGSSQITL